MSSAEGRRRVRGRRRWTALVVSVAATVLIVAAQASLTIGATRRHGRVEAVEAPRARSPTPAIASPSSDVPRAAPGGAPSRVPATGSDPRSGPGPAPAPDVRAAPPPPPSAPPRIGPAIILASWRPQGAALAADASAPPSGDARSAWPSEREEAGTAHEQRVTLDEAFAAQELGQDDLARVHFAAATSGPDERLRARAREELGASWLDEAYHRKALGDVAGARAAFRAARDAGVDPQQVEVELGHLAAARGRPGEARAHFSVAARGPDATLAREAREGLAVLPRHRWTELYAEGFGWHRVAGVERGGDFVPSTQLRFLFRPDLDVDLNLFVGLHLSRDFAWGEGLDAVPRTYAEGAILAAGVLFRAWEERVSLFVQAGPALRGSDATEEERGLRLDFRAGAALALESAQCWPSPAQGVELRWRPCADAWGEALYASRFERDMGLDVRGRAGGSFLVTGPLAWGVVAELRGALDREGALYGQLAEAGAGVRVRLLAPLRMDAIASVNRGRWLGIVRAPPDPATYTDLRFVVATYLEL